MFKLIFASFLVFSSFLSAIASNGNGAGNGGLGYVCKNNSLYERNQTATLMLDVIENLNIHYDVGHFNNHKMPHNQNRFEVLDNKLYQLSNPIFIKNVNKTKLSAEENKSLTIEFKKIFDDTIDLSIPMLSRLFSNEKLAKIRAIKDKILNEATFKYDIKKQLQPNITFDTGPIKAPKDSWLKLYGLKECKLAQLAILKETKQALTLKLFLGPLTYLDNLNLKVLFWHEVIYLAEPDLTSYRIRVLASRIAEHMR